MTQTAAIFETTDADRQQWWLNLADEASSPDFRREDFDADAMAAADQFSSEHGLPPFDVVADVDVALDLLRDSRNP